MVRKVSRAVAAILAGLVLAVLGTEAFFRIIDATPLRWVLPLPQVALYGPDFDTGYRHRPNIGGMWLTEHRNFIRTSNLGLRDRDRPLAHGAGPRAVIVGNSIIEAVQVSESADQSRGGRDHTVPRAAGRRSGQSRTVGRQARCRCGAP